MFRKVSMGVLVSAVLLTCCDCGACVIGPAILSGAATGAAGVASAHALSGGSAK